MNYQMQRLIMMIKTIVFWVLKMYAFCISLLGIAGSAFMIYDLFSKPNINPLTVLVYMGIIAALILSSAALYWLSLQYRYEVIMNVFKINDGDKKNFYDQNEKDKTE